MFLVFQVFHRYITNVLYRCCKSRSKCCICCNSYTSIFQVYVLNVLPVSNVCCKCFYLDVVKVDLNFEYTCMLQVYILSVSYVCCKCFIWMLHMFAMTFKCFPGILQLFQTYVASVSAVFGRLFHLCVIKVDLVLHMLQ
jgi:hypothetical protein